jgi:hypothetical protein
MQPVSHADHAPPRRREDRIRYPRRFGGEIEGSFSPHVMRAQFERLFRPFER